ncbi:hypothetical protein [uncultured Pseudoflavonifractor sp.]|uniref:hypothetical protein n=1 Tax=uncultured Pseudoflavonifractor sp. TaxID=1221379 RepID=UPI0025CDFB94|nr:hypothetical protein [uncultured Pseudoflavonifractor sp.]
MKRLYLALFLGMTLVLSACGAGNQAAPGGQSSPTPSPTAELSEESVPAAAQPAENQAQKVAQTDSADYTIERQDRSVANKDGSTALSWYYDLVQLTGDTPEIQAINDSLNSHCDEFFADNSGNLPLEKQPDDLWLNTMEAAVTQNGDGLLSVNMTRTWYMGGTANTDCLGYTYDLATGEELGLAGLTGQDPEALATTLREIVKAYMAGQPEAGWWEDAADTVDSRSLEDMIFWVDGGEIVLCFSTYDLTIGAYGPVIIPTGVMARG